MPTALPQHGTAGSWTGFSGSPEDPEWSSLSLESRRASWDQRKPHRPDSDT